MRLSTLLVVVLTTSVAIAAPSRRKLNKKFTRQTEEQAAPVVVPAGAAQQQSPDVTWKPETSSTTVLTIQKVPVIEAETGSVAPLGEVIESKPPVITTVKTVVEGESLSTPAPEDNKNEPPPPKVQLPTVNLAAQPAPAIRPAASRPPLPPNGPPPTLPPPPQKPIKKPGDEDDSSSEEDGEEAAEGAGDEEPSAEDETNEDEEDEEEDDEARKLSRTAINKRVGRQESAELVALDGDYGRNLDAFIPGYISEEGEVFVPIDTVDQGVPYTIIPDQVSGQGRIGILLRDDADEEDGDDDNDATTSEEEDDATPVRISSFQVIYKDKKKKKNKEKEGDDDDDADNDDSEAEDEDEEGTGEGGPDSVEEKEGSEEKRPPPPPEPPIIPVRPPKLAVVKPGSEKPGRPSVDFPVNYNPLRPPSLAYVPATLPTKEDDEDEFRRYRAGLAGPPSYPPYPYAYHPSYYYFNEPPALRDGHYFDTVRVLRRRAFA